MSRLDKSIAIFLQAGAAALLVTAGAGARVDDVYLFLFGLPGIAAGVSGLLLWGRKESTQPEVAPKPEPLAIRGDTVAIQEMLSSMQNEISQLREDREFYQELYKENRERQRV